MFKIHSRDRDRLNESHLNKLLRFFLAQMRQNLCNKQVFQKRHVCSSMFSGLRLFETSDNHPL
jgi:hypothetical protein